MLRLSNITIRAICYLNKAIHFASKGRIIFMMKETIEEILYKLQILPMGNNNWKKFDICLYSDSPIEEYRKAKGKIHDCVPKGTGGVYIIAKDEKVLYIGESKQNILRRLKRHIDKIYIRTDNRSDFFKLEEHQGHLSIYYWPLPPSLIDKRKAIEDLLTNALEPEYKKWDLKNKIDDLEKSLREDDKFIRNKENKHQVELKDGDFYDELDKNDMLDRLG
jgi:hypothetical protein